MFTDTYLAPGKPCPERGLPTGPSALIRICIAPDKDSFIGKDNEVGPGKAGIKLTRPSGAIHHTPFPISCTMDYPPGCARLLFGDHLIIVEPACTDLLDDQHIILGSW